MVDTRYVFLQLQLLFNEGVVLPNKNATVCTGNLYKFYRKVINFFLSSAYN